MQHVRNYLSHELRYRNRHRRSADGIVRTSRVQEADEPFIVHENNRRLPNWRSIRPLRPVRFESPPDSAANNSDVIRVQPYVWGMSITECSSPCGGGQQNVMVTCHAGRYLVADSYCDQSSKPASNGMRPCNVHACGSGRWVAGGSFWLPFELSFLSSANF